MESCLIACTRVGTVPAHFGHGEDAPPLGSFSNFRRSGPCIVADFTSDTQGDPVGLARLATAARFDASMLGFSVSPDSHVHDGEVAVDEVLSIDLVDCPSANPGGLAIPTEDELEWQRQRAAWEYSRWAKLFAKWD